MNAVPLRPLFVLRPGIRLVLASASPRRRQFMDEWGLPYTVVRPAGVEPRPGHGESPTPSAPPRPRRGPWPPRRMPGLTA